MAPPVWLITGASNGFGLLLSLKVLKAGHRVIATVRDAKRSANAVQSIERAGGETIVLDVTEPKASITQKIQDAEKIYGGIDYLVNNAGYSVLGIAELFTESEIEQQFQTNVFGAIYAAQAVLPSMRKRGSGTIVNVSSVAGHDGLPSCGIYAASKFALEGYSEALARETKEFGIGVLLVEPGAFRTNFLKASERSSLAIPQGYGGTVVEATLRKFEDAEGKQPGDPNKAIDIIFEVCTGEGAAGHLKGNILRLPLGNDALMRIQNKVHSVQHDLDAARPFASTTNLDEK